MTLSTSEIEKINAKGAAACWSLTQYVIRSESLYQQARRKGYDSAVMENYGRILSIREQAISEHPDVSLAVDCAHHLIMVRMIELVHDPLTAAILRNDPTYRFWEDRKVEYIGESGA